MAKLEISVIRPPFYEKIWDDRGTCGTSVSIFRPKVQDGFCFLGDIAVRTRDDQPSNFDSIVVKEVGHVVNTPSLLKKPIRFEMVWCDKKCGATYGDVSFWLPIAPSSYVALGYVASKGYKAPKVEDLRCVHKSICAPAAFPAHGGKSSGLGSTMPLFRLPLPKRPLRSTLYRIVPSSPSGLPLRTFYVDAYSADFRKKYSTFDGKEYKTPQLYCLRNPGMVNEAAPVEKDFYTNVPWDANNGVPLFWNADASFESFDLPEEWKELFTYNKGEILPATTATDTTAVDQLHTRRLEIKPITEYEKIWDDTGTGAKPYRLAVFKPVVEEGWHCIGHCIERSHNDEPTTKGYAVREIPNSQGVSLLKPPLSYRKVWSSQGCTSSFGAMAVWQPVAPDGYVALGCIATKAMNNLPSLDEIICVHKSATLPADSIAELVEQTTFGFFKGDELIGGALWADRNAGAIYGDVIFFRLKPASRNNEEGVAANTFVAYDEYFHRPGDDCFVLKRSVCS